MKYTKWAVSAMEQRGMLWAKATSLKDVYKYMEEHGDEVWECEQGTANLETIMKLIHKHRLGGSRESASEATTSEERGAECRENELVEEFERDMREAEREIRSCDLD